MEKIESSVWLIYAYIQGVFQVYLDRVEFHFANDIRLSIEIINSRKGSKYFINARRCLDLLWHEQATAIYSYLADNPSTEEIPLSMIASLVMTIDPNVNIISIRAYRMSIPRERFHFTGLNKKIVQVLKEEFTDSVVGYRLYSHGINKLLELTKNLDNS